MPLRRAAPVAYRDVPFPPSNHSIVRFVSAMLVLIYDLSILACIQYYCSQTLSYTHIGTPSMHEHAIAWARTQTLGVTWPSCDRWRRAVACSPSRHHTHHGHSLTPCTAVLPRSASIASIYLSPNYCIIVASIRFWYCGGILVAASCGVWWWCRP